MRGKSLPFLSFSWIIYPHYAYGYLLSSIYMYQGWPETETFQTYFFDTNFTNHMTTFTLYLSFWFRIWTNFCTFLFCRALYGVSAVALTSDRSFSTLAIGWNSSYISNSTSMLYTPLFAILPPLMLQIYRTGTIFIYTVKHGGNKDIELNWIVL